MKPTDTKDLIQGIIAVILFAISIGQFGALQSFARREAAKALSKPKPTAAFFPRNYSVPVSPRRS